MEQLSTTSLARLMNSPTHQILAFAICAQSSGFEDAVRRTVLYGGDSDTLAAIEGSLAEARWGIPAEILDKALELLPAVMRSVIENFKSKYGYGS